MNLAQSVAIPMAKGVVPLPVRSWVRELRTARRVRSNPGRIVLVNEILPAYSRLAGRILWIGCRLYTREYAAILERNGGECWTTDIEIAHAKWGATGRHFTWDLVTIDRLIAAESFDTLLCNGVF